MKNAEWNPGTLLETSGGYWKTCALHAAVQLDVFTVMEDQRLSAEAVAEKLQADPRALAMLLNALTAMNLLEKSGDLYANTPEAARFLSRNISRPISGISSNTTIIWWRPGVSSIRRF